MNYINLIIPLVVFLGALIITYVTMPVIIAISHSKHLVDDPSEERKLHKEVTPHLGGIAIFLAVTVVFLLSGSAHKIWVPYLIAGLMILFFSGLKDDITVISAGKKFLLQIVAVASIILWGHACITNLGGVFGFHGIAHWKGVILTFFTMTVVINAYNLIDGIDGLAGGIGLIASLFFGGWFWYTGMMSYAILAMALAGALVGFLYYNFQPASIFMGDTGSQVVGYILAFLAVMFVRDGVTASNSVPFQNAVPILVLSVLIVPLYDTLRVFLIRLAHGKSPFQPDRRHVHHQLLDVGFSHKVACFIICSFNILLIGLTLLLASMNVNWLLVVVLGTTVILFPTMHLKRRLLKQVGVSLPSAQDINAMESRYGVSPKDQMRQNGHSKENEERQKEIPLSPRLEN